MGARPLPLSADAVCRRSGRHNQLLGIQFQEIHMDPRSQPGEVHAISYVVHNWYIS